MLHPMMSARWGAILAACAAFGACADNGSALPAELGCRRSGECQEGLDCSFNHCIVPEANELVLQARITPPPTSGLLPQQIPELALADGPDRLVQLLAPTILRGTVQPLGNPLATNIDGEITVRTEGDIPGLELVFSAHSLEGVDVDGFGYALAVLPGRSYEGTFRPADKTLPRHLFRLEPADIQKGRFDLKLPARADYLALSGRVMKSDYTAIAGARLVVLSATNEVAAVTTSDELRGFWEVLVPPGLNTYTIKVEPPEEGVVFPAFETELMSYVADEPIDLIVPDLPAGTEPIEIKIRVLAPDAPVEAANGLAPVVLKAAPGRTVTIVGVLAGGTLTRTGTTDAVGEVRFLALPGAYECVVASPPQSGVASWHGYVNLANWTDGSSAAPVEIELAPRVPFVGRVVDAFGLPVEAGKLTLERKIDAREGERLYIAPAPFETQLGADGVFMTVVDPGTYDLLVSPEAGTGAPHVFESDIVIGDEGLRFDLGLPPPGLLHLTVAGPDRTWIAGSQVELWTQDDAGARQLLAIDSTGEDGFVDVLVPHLGTTGALLDRFLPDAP